MNIPHFNSRTLLLSSMMTVAAAALYQAQQVPEKDSVKTEDKRNVMLNASSANGPRFINIGLPSEDVSVYENGLPAVYSSVLQAVSTHWRSDASLKEVGLLNLSETAITTGNLAYAVNSFSNLGTDQFQGMARFNGNHFGMMRFDMNVSGAINKNWLYSVSTFQNYDPGSFKLKFMRNWDATQLYKVALTRKLGDKGKISLQYKYADSKRMDGAVELAPFIYNGDGSVTEVPGFALGTDSYLPADGRISMLDMVSGKYVEAGLKNESGNHSNELMLNADYTFDNGLKWIVNAKIMKSYNSYLWIGAPSIRDVVNGYEVGTETDPTAPVYYLAGSTQPFSGKKQNRIAIPHYGTTQSSMITSELQKKFGKHHLNLGINQWYYDITYWSNTTRYDQEVKPYPNYITHTLPGEDGQYKYYAYNYGGSEYYDGFENKTALYLTDKWDVNDKLNFFVGGRVEYYTYKGKNLPYDRFDNFHIGATIPGTNQTVTPADFSGKYVNMALTAIGTYRITDKLGVTLDGTMVTRRPRIEDYATPYNPSTKQTQISLARLGAFYNSGLLNVTSYLSYIKKTNNRTVVNISNPAPGSSETKASAFLYDIQTIGWTTDVTATPFTNFDFHFLFTYQKPTYKKFATTVVFADGTSNSIDASGNIVTEIPEVLIELDPSYRFMDNKFKVWLSARYFSKTYANLSNALYFKGRWETFGGVNYYPTKKLEFGVNVINILNQSGAIGTIAGSELIQKSEAARFNGTWMAGKYIRPFTVEFSVTYKF